MPSNLPNESFPSFHSIRVSCFIAENEHSREIDCFYRNVPTVADKNITFSSNFWPNTMLVLLSLSKWFLSRLFSIIFLFDFIKKHRMMHYWSSLTVNKTCKKTEYCGLWEPKHAHACNGGNKVVSHHKVRFFQH